MALVCGHHKPLPVANIIKARFNSIEVRVSQSNESLDNFADKFSVTPDKIKTLLKQIKLSSDSYKILKTISLHNYFKIPLFSYLINLHHTKYRNNNLDISYPNQNPYFILQF